MLRTILLYSTPSRYVLPTFNEAMKVDQKPSFIMIFTYKMAPVVYERQSERKRFSNGTEDVKLNLEGSKLRFIKKNNFSWIIIGANKFLFQFCKKIVSSV
jgi:hypothetical protein